jgi:hypothetical protein
MNASMLFVTANPQPVPASHPSTHQEHCASGMVHSRDLNRLLSAAVVSPRFCRLLLTDPATALEKGFNGEGFALNQDERRRVLNIRASSLQSFASQLIDEKADDIGVNHRRQMKVVQKTASPQPRSADPAERRAILERKSPATLVTEATTYLGKALNELSLARRRAGFGEPELETTIRHAETAVQLATEPLLHLLHELAPPAADFPPVGYGSAPSGD